MNTKEDTNVRNRVWRRISVNVTRENVSALARAARTAFGRLIVCGRKDDTASLASDAESNNSKLIYTGQKIDVPWTREEFKYPAGRYLTNEETLKEINLLELRVRAQSEILRDKNQKLESAERRTREAMDQFVVPWKGEEFKYPNDRYLTNEETKEQLDSLELRFSAQSRILREKEQRIESELNMEERSRQETMERDISQSDRKFAGLCKLVKEFKKYVAKKRLERGNTGKEVIG